MMNRGTLFAVLSAVSVSGTEPGLLLHSNFDRYNTAPVFHASPECRTGGIAPDLQLRMFPNIKGEGNSVCLNNKERITYNLAGNFRPDRGTVSLWINLQNWDLSDMKYFNCFFEVSSAPSQYRLVIYKYPNHRNAVTFYLQAGKRSCTVFASVPDWKKDSWHKLDAVWDQKEMKLYADARLISGTQSRRLPAGMKLPERIKGALITLNSQVGWRHNPDWITAYDELKIYDRCLSGEEIVRSYEKYFPRNFEVNARPGLVTIPPASGAVKIDGRLDGAEWKDAAAFPAVNYLNSQSGHPVKTIVRSMYDKDNLYLAFKVHSPVYRKRVSNPDGELWNDDSVEFHVLGTDGKKRHFIINAAGAVYDSLDGKSSWNAGARAAGSHTQEYWCAEAAIPLKSLGTVSRGVRLKANFGVNNWRQHSNYHSWNYIHGYLKGFSSPEFFGTLVFGERSDAVRYLHQGSLTDGNLEIRLEGQPGMKASASWIAETGASGKSGKDVLKETWSAELPACRNIIRVSVRNKAGKEVFSCWNLVRVQQPFDMSYSGRASRKLLKVDLSVNKAIVKEENGKIRLLDAAGNILAERVFQMKKDRLQLDFPLPPGLKEKSSYTLEAIQGDTRCKRIFRMPDLTPFKTRVGIDHTVPEPWTPVRISGKEYHAGSRCYVFDRGPLPSAIKVNGKSVLSRPPVLRLNGREVQWQGIVPGRNYGDHAEFSAVGRCGSAAFDCRCEFWFDGMFRWDLTIKPSSGEERIQSLNLVWSMPNDAAKYILNPYYVPWKNRQARLKWSVDERRSLVWLTGIDRGLAWWCQSDANWVIDDNAGQIFLSRDQSGTSVRVEMIQKPSSLKTAAGYTMVFQATPPRKLDTSFRRLRFHSWRIGGTNCGISGWNTSAGIRDPSNILHYTTLIPAHPDGFRKFTRTWKEKGVLNLTYSMPAHIGRLSPEYDYFYPEWAVTPGVKWGAKDEFTGVHYYVEPCCGRTAGADLQAYRADRLLNGYPDLGGIYFDISHVISCDNPLHGCGGTDAFGKKFRSSTALALREYFLRIYKITRKYHRSLWLHAHNAYYPFVHDFADLWAPGEEQYFPLMKNPEKHYLTGISEEEYQSAWNGAVRGVGIMMIPQNARVLGGNAALKKQKEHLIGPAAIDRLFMLFYLYDMNIMGFHSGNEKTTIVPFWQVRDKIRLSEAEFHGYWTSPAVTSARSGIRVSWYSWKKPSPYSRLLAIGNFNSMACSPDLKIDWNKLGVDPSAAWHDPASGKVLNREKLLVPAEKVLLIGIK